MLLYLQSVDSTPFGHKLAHITKVGICTIKDAVSTITSSPKAKTKSGMPIFLLNPVIKNNCDAENIAAIVKVIQNNFRKGTCLKYFL